MPDLTSLPHQIDAQKGICRAIIETPKGCRNKCDYDRDSGLFMLGGLLPEGLLYPFEVVF
jgi:inorganic pyrophosphatase